MKKPPPPQKAIICLTKNYGQIKCKQNKINLKYYKILKTFIKIDLHEEICQLNRNKENKRNKMRRKYNREKKQK